MLPESRFPLQVLVVVSERHYFQIEQTVMYKWNKIISEGKKMTPNKGSDGGFENVKKWKNEDANLSYHCSQQNSYILVHLYQG